MSSIVELLPGFNCGRCKRRTCEEFAVDIGKGSDMDACPFLSQERFAPARSRLDAMLSKPAKEEKLIGVIDGEEAQFSLLPLPGERSCREDIYPFDRDANVKEGEMIQYRPLGCPITHFAKVLGVSKGIVTVHIIGPQNILMEGVFEPRDIGVCMVAAFEGVLGEGKAPKVGQTVRFLPHHCMMGKVHGGIIVLMEGRKIRIEGIDLKVWSLSK